MEKLGAADIEIDFDNCLAEEAKVVVEIGVGAEIVAVVAVDIQVVVVGEENTEEVECN